LGWRKFQYIRYKFGYNLETIEHFEDVKENRMDGFVPIEKIERKKMTNYGRSKTKIGY
jgi:hypothetical protein